VLQELTTYIIDIVISRVFCSTDLPYPIKKVKVKQSRYRPEQVQRVDRGIALPFRNLGSRKGCVLSNTTRPLYPLERPDTHCTGGWVGLRAGLDVCDKPRPHRDSIPGPSIP
jgi:hypothetical protein